MLVFTGLYFFTGFSGFVNLRLLLNPDCHHNLLGCCQVVSASDHRLPSCSCRKITQEHGGCQTPRDLMNTLKKVLETYRTIFIFLFNKKIAILSLRFYRIDEGIQIYLKRRNLLLLIDYFVCFRIAAILQSIAVFAPVPPDVIQKLSGVGECLLLHPVAGQRSGRC